MTQRSGTEHAFLDLSVRAKFRVTGADRFRFLNGQITNDVRKVSETAAIEACVLNAKGKLNAHIFIGGLEENFLIDAAPELREHAWSVTSSPRTFRLTMSRTSSHSFIFSQTNRQASSLLDASRHADLPRRVGTFGAIPHATMQCEMNWPQHIDLSILRPQM